MDSQLELAKQNLDWMLDWIGRFDNKSSILLGLDLGMLSLLVTQAPTFVKWTKWMWLTSILTMIAMTLSFVCIYFSNFPRTKGPESSYFYFGSIANIKNDEFCKRFTTRKETEHIEDLLSQTYRNAEILKTKFEFLKGAYSLLILGVAPWAATLLLFNGVS